MARTTRTKKPVTAEYELRERVDELGVRDPTFARHRGEQTSPFWGWNCSAVKHVKNTTGNHGNAWLTRQVLGKSFATEIVYEQPNDLIDDLM